MVTSKYVNLLMKGVFVLSPAIAGALLLVFTGRGTALIFGIFAIPIMLLFVTTEISVGDK